MKNRALIEQKFTELAELLKDADFQDGEGFIFSLLATVEKGEIAGVRDTDENTRQEEVPREDMYQHMIAGGGGYKATEKLFEHLIANRNGKFMKKLFENCYMRWRIEQANPEEMVGILLESLENYMR